MKVFKQTVTTCLNCPNKIRFTSENIDRCKAVTHRKGNFRVIKVDDILKDFPIWCPLDNID